MERDRRRDGVQMNRHAVVRGRREQETQVIFITSNVIISFIKM